jgi:5-methylcytosine-specific restriction endonuclease McrA
MHHIEQVIARQPGGSDEIDNLALACHRCNLHKGPNLTGVDPSNGRRGDSVPPAARSMG